MICDFIRYIYFYICYVYEDMRIDEQEEYDYIEYKDIKDIKDIKDNNNTNTNNKYTVNVNTNKDKYIELKPYCNDKYSDGNIIIVIDKDNKNNKNNKNDKNDNNLSNVRNRARSDDDQDLEWTVL